MGFTETKTLFVKCAILTTNSTSNYDVNKNKTLRPPTCDNPTTIPTRVGMVMLMTYWIALGSLLVYGTVDKLDQNRQIGSQVTQDVL